MGNPTSWPLQRKKEMPASRPAFGLMRSLSGQRSAETATFVLPMPMFHEAGTCRGRDIAHAATIVARSTRRVHMIVSSRKDG
jgi:hypothetical protein